MGLSLEFYAGCATIIGPAFGEVEFDDLRDGTKAAAYADLSLHLGPKDLDILSEIAARYLDVEPILLSDCLIDEIGTIDGAETGGADVVAPDWVGMMSLLEEQDAETLAADWIAAVARTAGISPEITDHPTKALASLIRLCKKAIAEGLDVVHVWYL